MNDIRTDFMAHRYALVEDLNALLADAQALVRDVKGSANAGKALATAEIDTRLQLLRARLEATGANGRKHAALWADSTDRYVQDHPWQTIGIIAAVSAAAGALAMAAIRRR